MNKPSKLDLAWRRFENRMRRKWESEKPVTAGEKAYGQYLRTCERIQGAAAGWIAGVNWARRAQPPKK